MYFVTGVSRGLGLGIVQALLKRGDRVVGIGRSHSIDHPNFSFIKCDLSDISAVEALSIDVPSDEPVTLINNAGIIGGIQRLSDQEKSVLEKVLTVNTVAPTILTSKVYGGLKNKDQFTLVNISSGAANRPIPSWAAYCASKAALNMLTDTFYLEELEKGNHPKVYAVAPGVIDTDMQGEIRSSGVENFAAVGNFIAMKESGQLYSSEEAANRLLRLLDQPFNGETRLDLRNV